MKASLKLACVFLVGALSSVACAGEIQPLKIEATTKPQLSPVMLMEGVTHGRVVFAIDVNEQGQITDWMVLASSHRALVAPCIEALKEWKITPATRDGQPVPVQTEISIDYTAEGVVISRTLMMDVDQHMQRLFGLRMDQPGRLTNKLDAGPTRVTTVAPRYAKEAEAKGVRGKVQVHFYIDETGAVRMPSIEESPDPYLSEMAIAAVREWKFEPPTSRGQPVLVAARQEFNFGK